MALIGAVLLVQVYDPLLAEVHSRTPWGNPDGAQIMNCMPSPFVMSERHAGTGIGFTT